MTESIDPLDFESSGDLFFWMRTEGGALCPSMDRLLAYEGSPTRAEVSDVRFHVEQVGCRLCGASLEDRGFKVSEASSPIPPDKQENNHRQSSAQAVAGSTQPGTAASAETELEREFTEHRRRLCESLRKRFPHLSADMDVEDVVQAAYQELLLRVRNEGWRPQNWVRYLARIATNRATDKKRRVEAETKAKHKWEEFQQSLAGHASSPLRTARRRERRHRQHAGLLGLFHAYCRAHEKTSVGPRRKEILERSLSGQGPAQIADEMGIKPGLVSQDIRRNGDWLAQHAAEFGVRSELFSFVSPTSS